MLKQLIVQNFALIESQQITASDGLTVLTGETGAGKSILLGAIQLLLGVRADLKSLKDPTKPCVVEGIFDLSKIDLLDLFRELSLDYELECIIRREIRPKGRSRAFINDSPVNLDALQAVGVRLMDIHSQNDTLLLKDQSFQLSLIDSFAQNESQLKQYQEVFPHHQDLKKELKNLQEEQHTEGGDRDYLQFLFEELEEAKLVPGELEEIELKLESLEHGEQILEAYAEAISLIDGESLGIYETLKRAGAGLNAVARYHPAAQELGERLRSLSIELDDIRQELEQSQQNLEFDPAEKVKLDQRQSQIMHLLSKHRADDLDALLSLKSSLEDKILKADSRDHKILAIETELEKVSAELKEKALVLTNSRQDTVPKLEEALKEILASLNMADAELCLEIEVQERFTERGNNQLNFFFTANKGQAPRSLSKVASGGEMSRVMLALKSVLASTKSLPTIIFDEIDTGVSGDTAHKIGQILHRMGQNMQVICITHLAQIAAKGQQHWKVYKQSEQGKTLSKIEILPENQRVSEVARLISGEDITEAALAQAKELITNC